jgi:hypothetical protein
MVFGGWIPNTRTNTMAILNGTATWVTKQLKYPRDGHAMVLLPCP